MLEFECRTQEEFFKILSFYRVATYQQKVFFMKKNWGNILVKTTIPYGEKCNITIGIGDDNKYYFDFNCTEIEIAEMQEVLPEYAEAILNLDEETLKKSYPEIIDINALTEDFYCSKEKNTETFDCTSHQEDVSICRVSPDYMNIYNGINIKRNIND